MRSNMRKAQLTLFMILGIILIAAFSFVFYIYKVKVDSRLGPATSQISGTLSRDSAIRSYVISCLEQVSSDALVLAAAQSGYIYDFQAKGAMYPYFDYYVVNSGWVYGSSIVPFLKDGYLMSAVYGIRQPMNDSFHKSPPYYPYKGSLVELPMLVNAFGNYVPAEPIRTTNLPTLCYRNSSNDYNLSGFRWSCEKPYANIAKYSVQHFIEMYVANMTRKCMNLTIVKEKGYNVTEAGQINVTVLFGEETVVFGLKYPLKVTFQGKQPTTDLLTFTTERPVRFKKVYELANHIIKEDVRNIFFDYSNVSYLRNCPTFNVTSRSRSRMNSSCLYPGMNVSVYRDVCSYCGRWKYSDIIVIKDYSSIVDNRPFVFAFAVENRIPALDFIDESVNRSFFYNLYVNQTYGLNLSRLYSNISRDSVPLKDDYNIVLEVGDNVEILPFAFDPDGDGLTYNYSGWMTRIKILNSSGEDYKYTVTFSDGAHLTISGPTVSGGSVLPMNKWQASTYYLNGKKVNFPKFKDAVYPPLATARLQPSDVGYHWVRLNVSDHAGLYDWQDIKIQVRCKPDGGKCCDEFADYHYRQMGTGCGPCMRCNLQGKCEIDTSPAISLSDCGPCQKCGLVSGVAKCVEDNSDFSTGCQKKFPGHPTKCCSGNCNNMDISVPWQSGKCIECYDQSAGCVGQQYQYRMKAPGTLCGPVSTFRCDSKARCVNSTYPPIIMCYSDHADLDTVCDDLPTICS